MEPNALRSWFDHRVETHEFSGVALVWTDGGPLFQYAGGIAHRGHQVPITSETRFGVASVTKMVTATTALRLVDREELRLDQPLVEVLPAEHQTRAMAPGHTLHHLLSHTSGCRTTRRRGADVGLVRRGAGSDSGEQGPPAG